MMGQRSGGGMRLEHYDLLVVGSGLFGSVVAHEAAQAGKSVLVVERRSQIGGNCYTERIEGIDVHVYGPHIFHTDDRSVWEYLGRFCDLRQYETSVMANYHGELYNLPFNMNTFYQLWGCATPAEAMREIERQRIVCEVPENLEEHALSIAGRDIYHKLIQGYTEKRWGRPCSELPASVMRRIPFRFRFDNNFFNDVYQGIPEEGFTKIFERMLAKCDVELEIDYLADRDSLRRSADTVVFTGAIDEYFDYCFGPLEYRSLSYEHEVLDMPNYQGAAVVNYTDRDTPFMRVVEHKHFSRVDTASTVISREYTQEWSPGIEPYYPMEDETNRARYERYRELSEGEDGVLFGGRLGEYRYYDMQETIASALRLSKEIIG